jgi:ribosomal protein S8
MNFSFLRVLNKIQTALRVKKYKIHLKYSEQNMIFLKFLQENGFIAGIVRNKSLLSVFLSYDRFLTPILRATSICSRKGYKRPEKRLAELSTNYLINLKANDNKKTRLLARFF